jgi:hypothetical protein
MRRSPIDAPMPKYSERWSVRSSSNSLRIVIIRVRIERAQHADDRLLESRVVVEFVAADVIFLHERQASAKSFSISAVVSSALRPARFAVS